MRKALVAAALAFTARGLSLQAQSIYTIDQPLGPIGPVASFGESFKTLSVPFGSWEMNQVSIWVGPDGGLHRTIFGAFLQQWNPEESAVVGDPLWASGYRQLFSGGLVDYDLNGMLLAPDAWYVFYLSSLEGNLVGASPFFNEFQGGDGVIGPTSATPNETLRYDIAMSADIRFNQTEVVTTPEPATLLMAGTGLIGVVAGSCVRRRRSRFGLGFTRH
jgi:hypothetical protein